MLWADRKHQGKAKTDSSLPTAGKRQLGHNGAKLEAQKAAAKALEMEPRFTVKFAHNMFSKVHARMRDALLEGLRKAGVSEG